MSDFRSILRLWQYAFTRILSLEIPLGSDLTIKFGNILLGIIGLTLFIRLLFRIFSDAGALASKEIHRKEK